MRRLTAILLCPCFIMAVACGGVEPVGDDPDALNETPAADVQGNQEPAVLVTPVFWGELLAGAGSLLINSGIGNFIVGGLVKGIDKLFGGGEDEAVQAPVTNLPKANGVGCAAHTECQSGYCDSGVCGTAPPPRCTSDAQCVTGYSCDVSSGQCLPAQVHSNTQVGACTANSQCPSGTDCDIARGVCVAWGTDATDDDADDSDDSSSTGNLPDNAVCQNSNDCQSGVCLRDQSNSDEVIYICASAQTAEEVSYNFTPGVGCSATGAGVDFAAYLLLICGLALLRRSSARSKS